MHHFSYARISRIWCVGASVGAALIFAGAVSPASAAPNEAIKMLENVDRYVCRSLRSSKCGSPTKKMKAGAKKNPPAKNIGAQYQDNFVRAKPQAIKNMEKPAAVAKSPLRSSAATPLVPTPRPKPSIAKQAALIAPGKVPEASSGIQDIKCREQLADQGAVFAVSTDEVKTGLCSVPNPVRLRSVKTKTNTIELPDRPLLNCQFALQFTKWLRESGGPIISAQMNAPLRKITTGPGFECRGRNGDASAKISEHGYGNAVDISTFHMQDGQVLSIEGPTNISTASNAVLDGLRASACGYFTTVLGPGSNAAHATHFHFDMGAHGKSGNYRICE
jgi:hypothetical protein